MMADTINKVCVIGAGVMGAGIAAQVANAGVPVLLLDIVPKDGADRDAIAKGAVAKMLKTEPAAFMSPAAAKLVETGNIEDHLGKVAECDWIVEAVVERLDIKQALYARLEELKRLARRCRPTPRPFRSAIWSRGGRRSSDKTSSSPISSIRRAICG